MWSRVPCTTCDAIKRSSTLFPEVKQLDKEKKNVISEEEKTQKVQVKGSKLRSSVISHGRISRVSTQSKNKSQSTSGVQLASNKPIRLVLSGQILSRNRLHTRLGVFEVKKNKNSHLKRCKCFSYTVLMYHTIDIWSTWFQYRRKFGASKQHFICVAATFESNGRERLRKVANSVLQENTCIEIIWLGATCFYLRGL